MEGQLGASPLHPSRTDRAAVAGQSLPCLRCQQLQSKHFVFPKPFVSLFTQSKSCKTENLTFVSIKPLRITRGPFDFSSFQVSNRKLLVFSFSTLFQNQPVSFIFLFFFYWWKKTAQLLVALLDYRNFHILRRRFIFSPLVLFFNLQPSLCLFFILLLLVIIFSAFKARRWGRRSRRVRAALGAGRGFPSVDAPSGWPAW